MDTKQEINKLKQNVTETFLELKSALMMREKLLLRQLDVIKQQMDSKGVPAEEGEPAGIDFICDTEGLLAAIRNFGRYQLTNINLALHDVYLKNEDYIEPLDDHETLFKGINHIDDIALNDFDLKESIVVDFSQQKSLMEHNAKLMNNSIINITLKEAKKLIKQAKIKRETYPVPPLNLEELDDEVESSIAEAVTSLGAQSSEYANANSKYSQTFTQQQQTTGAAAAGTENKQKRFKPKITINNCNGTINLKNIASLTINCTADDNIQAQIPTINYANDDQSEQDDQQEAKNLHEGQSSSQSMLHKNSTKSQKSKTLVESLVSSSSSNSECTTSPTSTSKTTTPHSISNFSSNNSSRSQSKKQKSKKSANKIDKISKDCKKHNTKNSSSAAVTTTNHHHIDDSGNTEEEVYIESTGSSEQTCDFYNRLLNEIKKSISQQQKTRSKYASMADANTNETSATSQPADSTTNTQGTSSYSGSDFLGGVGPNGRRLILKNYENLKIILEAHSSGDEESFHPVQIEQWLAEIISETDLEPMQNTDILEHSKIYSTDEHQDT